MFLKRTNWQEKYFELAKKNLAVAQHFDYLQIDFSKPWWYIFSQVKLTMFGVFFYNIVSTGFYVSFPVLIGFIFNTGNVALLWGTIGVWLFQNLFIFFFNKNWILLYAKIQGSYEYATQKLFLTTDPQNHATTAGGELLSKVERGNEALNDIVFLLTEDIGPVIVELLTATAVIFILGWQYGLLGLGLMLFMTIFSSVYNVFHINLIESKVIGLKDAVKQVKFENLTQINLVRSTFSTDSQLLKASKALQDQWAVWNLKWRLINFGHFALTFVFIGFVSWISFSLLNQVQAGLIAPEIAIGVLASFIPAFFEALEFGHKFEKFTSSLVDVKDTYRYITSYGQQTYPVLQEDLNNTKILHLAHNNTNIN